MCGTRCLFNSSLLKVERQKILFLQCHWRPFLVQLFDTRTLSICTYIYVIANHNNAYTRYVIVSREPERKSYGRIFRGAAFVKLAGIQCRPSLAFHISPLGCIYPIPSSNSWATKSTKVVICEWQRLACKSRASRWNLLCIEVIQRI